MMKNNTVAFITVVLVLSVTSVFSLNIFLQQRDVRDKLDIRSFPYIIGEWKGQDLKVTGKEYEVLGTSNLILRRYTRPSGENLYLFIIYSETDRSVFHPPEVCLMGSGVDIVNKKTEIVDCSEKKFSVNRLDVEKNHNKEVILYCYKAGGLLTDNFYLQQAYLAFSQLLGKNAPGATIRVTMPAGNSEKDTLDVLKSFIAEVASEIAELSI